MKIELVAPDAVFAGAEVWLEIVLISEGITRVASAEAELVASQGFTFGGVHDEWSYPPHRERILGDRLLSAGSTTRHRFAVTPPADQPPSHAMGPAYAFVELTVVVSIAGGRDVRAAFRLPIHAATPRVVTRKSASLGTRGPRQAAPRLELSLASTRIVAGELLVGAIAVFHVDDRRARQVELVLQPLLALLGNGVRADVRDAVPSHRFQIEVPAGGAGRVVHFELDVPATLMPSFVAATHALFWELAVRADRLELASPIEILDASAGAATAALTAAPGLADARVAAVFDEFAVHHGWRADGSALERTDVGIAQRIAYDYRGTAGTYLVARCGYPALGLGLEAGPRKLFGSSIALGIAAWDDRHQVRARSAAQVVEPLRAVVPSLLSAGVLGAVVRWTDDELVIERRVMALDGADLLAASDALARIAANLRRARDLVVPPIDVELPAWRQLARRWGGELRPGDLGITGNLDGAPVRVGLRFDERGAPVALAAAVGPTAMASREVVRELPAALGARWPEAIVELAIADGIASAAWTWGDRLDASHARTLVESLRAVVAHLEPAANPYR